MRKDPRSDMPSRLRRSRYLFGYLREGHILDLAALFRGTIQDAFTSDIYVMSLSTGQTHLLSRHQAEVLLAIPANRWIDLDGTLDALPDSGETVRDLVGKGLLLSDNPRSLELEKREDALESSHWDVHAAIYHSMKRWRDVQVVNDGPRAGDSPPLVDEKVDGEDPPPNHFHSASRSRGAQRLARPGEDSPLSQLLLKRASTRSFDLDRSLASEHLSTLLYYGFGCHGILEVESPMPVLKKTSPSGGALHAVEAYPLVRDVGGIVPGLYHYSVEHHALEILEPLSMEEASNLGYVFTAGQAFTRSAHVLLVLTARFDREFWKYRKHAKAYGVLHMDVGHLSQTVYLLCAELGLGACITGAINDANIDERLGLDGIGEGALAVIACGIPGGDPGGIDPAFTPYP